MVSRAGKALWLGVVWLTCAIANFGNAAVLPHAPLVPTEAELARLSRVRSLLNSATATHRQPVHIVFYGQSITLGTWWRTVADELRRLYPHVDFRIENRAISGFQDWALARTVVADLIPLQPDLVIFHAYGTDNGTDLFLRQLRQHTVADVLVQSDHLHLDSSMDEEVDPAKLVPRDVIPYRNYVRLPADCDRHGACVARVRDAWKAYCRSNGVSPSALLADGIHPNADGNLLMAEFVLAYLHPGPLTEDPDRSPRVKTATLGQDAYWRSGVLECDFTGSSIMAKWTGPLNGEVEVWVDGKRAGERSELLGFSRVSPGHFSGWPALSQVSFVSPLQEETWTFTPFNVTAGGLNFSFRVSGSITGPDGEGTNTARFVSRSGRVVIESGDHWIPLAVHFSGQKPLPEGFSAVWSTERHYHDPLLPGQQPPADLRTRVRLVQGLSDGPHRLRLVQRGAQTPSLLALQAYSPSGQAMMQDAISTPPISERLSWSVDGDATVLRWSAELQDWTLEFTREPSLPRQWSAISPAAFQRVENQFQFRFSLPFGVSAQWFRLRAPEANHPESAGALWNSTPNSP